MYEYERQAYDTHFNYISCLASLSKNLELKSSLSFRSADTPLTDTKRNLISLTKRSLNDELEIVKADKDYSYASTSWLPIKSYYLLFNILLTTEYLFKLQKESYGLSHKHCIECFVIKLREGEIKFSEPLFNQVFDAAILDTRVSPGSNLSSRTSTEDMYKMVIRKVATYKVDEWKRQNNITHLRKEPDKNRFKQFLSKFEVSIFDFPYYMRIRANYRDFAFINGIDTNDTANYFNKYFAFTAGFVKAIEGLNQEIIRQRNGNNS